MGSLGQLFMQGLMTKTSFTRPGQMAEGEQVNLQSIQRMRAEPQVKVRQVFTPSPVPHKDWKPWRVSCGDPSMRLLMTFFTTFLFLHVELADRWLLSFKKSCDSDQKLNPEKEIVSNGVDSVENMKLFQSSHASVLGAGR